MMIFNYDPDFECSEVVIKIWAISNYTARMIWPLHYQILFFALAWQLYRIQSDTVDLT